MKSKIITAALVGVVVLLSFSSAHAAVLSLTPASSEIGLGEKMTIGIIIDSEGVSFNAAQAVVRFPKDTLEVVSLDKTNSAFGFWLEEPHFSNTEGVVSFTGGTPYGVSGAAVEILKIEFAPKGTGSSTFSVTEAAVTASDGSGTNILSRINEAVFTVMPQRTIPEPQQKIPEPEQIVREPEPAEKVPVAPVVKIPLYPEQDRWYNLVSSFTASWDLPLDISGVNMLIDKYPNSIPPRVSEGLFDNKTFSALEDGTWYLHVRFKNNVGWGATAHYKIAVDTQPPLGFEVTVQEGKETDNPAPTFQFQTSDALSGIKEYQVRINNGDLAVVPLEGFTGSFKLPLQEPGTRRVFIKAVDLAENSVENSVDIEILPIVSPTITFLSSEIFLGEEQGLMVKGTALPSVSILFTAQKLLRKGGVERVATATVQSDENGNWELTFENHLFKNGRYTILAQAQDSRGALSLTVESQEMQVKSKPVIQIGKFELGMTGLLIFLLLVIVVGFSVGWFSYRLWREQVGRKAIIAQRDVLNICTMVEESINKALKSCVDKHVDEREAEEIEFLLKKIKSDLEKARKYVSENIREISK